MGRGCERGVCDGVGRRRIGSMWMEWAGRRGWGGEIERLRTEARELAAPAALIWEP